MKILIIEDDKGIIEFLKPSLESEGFIVDTSEDGIKGFLLARNNDYDLIVLDYGLPGKDGLEICGELRKLGKTLPILILSVRTEVNNKVDFLSAGADDYITKPFSFRELLARIKALLKRSNNLEAETLEVGDLKMNREKFRVERDGKEIKLTKKEFTLLEYLVRNKGRVLSKAMIINNVWNNDSDLLSNVIETHILNLRKKINKGHKVKLIHTISGVGYRIE